MPIYAKSNDYPLAPEGRFPAVVADVIDLGMEESFGAKKHMVRLIWQLSITQENGQRHQVSRKYNLSTHKDSSLRGDLEGMLGRRLSKEEALQFDVESIIGENCMLEVEHHSANGRVYANVAELAPPPAGVPLLTVCDYIRVCDRKEGLRSAPRANGLGYRGSSQKAEPLPDGVPVPSSGGIGNDDVPF